MEDVMVGNTVEYTEQLQEIINSQQAIVDGLGHIYTAQLFIIACVVGSVVCLILYNAIKKFL